MLKTSELTGAQLDYWTARAEGIPAEQLTIRRVPRTDWLHVVRSRPVATYGTNVMRFSTDWAQGGPLLEKHKAELTRADDAWSAQIVVSDGAHHEVSEEYDASTALEAICRAVVRAAFGDEVEEVAVCE